MRLAVTGASGDVGRILCKALAKRGHRIHGIFFEDSVPQSCASLVDSAATGVDLSVPGIYETEEGRELFGNVDCVLHLAARPKPWEKFEVIWKNNLMGDYNVLEMACSANVPRVVLASSTHIHHGKLMLDGCAEGIRHEEFGKHHGSEDAMIGMHEIDCSSFYGIGKVFSESMGKWFARHRGLEFLALRIGWMVPEENPFDSKWIGDEDARNFMRAVYPLRTAMLQRFSAAHARSIWMQVQRWVVVILACALPSLPTP